MLQPGHLVTQPLVAQQLAPDEPHPRKRRQAHTNDDNRGGDELPQRPLPIGTKRQRLQPICRQSRKPETEKTERPRRRIELLVSRHPIEEKPTKRRPQCQQQPNDRDSKKHSATIPTRYAATTTFPIENQKSKIKNCNQRQ